MKVALDTNCYSALMRGDSQIQMLLETAEHMYLPFVVAAELHFGFLRGTKQQHNVAQLDDFLRQPTVSVLYPDRLTLRHHATLRMQLHAAGTPIPVNDLWIAALVVQHGLSLVTRDAHFNAIPQIHRARLAD